VQKRIGTEIMAAQVGKREHVLIEHVSKRSASEMFARTDGYRAVVVPVVPGVVPGALVDVEIERATPATLFGRVVALSDV